MKAHLFTVIEETDSHTVTIVASATNHHTAVQIKNLPRAGVRYVIEEA